MRTDRLRHHSFSLRYLTLFGGEIVSKLCVMGAFAYLAHQFTAAQYGTVELALSITVLLLLGVESGMGLYGARILATSPERVTQLVPQVMVVRAIVGLPIYVAVLIAAGHYDWVGLSILTVSGAGILVTPFLTQWVFQGFRQMQWVATGAILRNLTFVVLVLVLVRPGSELNRVAVAELAGLTALALFNAFVLHRHLRVHLDWRGVATGAKRVFRDVWFMGIGDFAWACQWYAPVIVTGWIAFEHPEEVAWIAVCVRIVLSLHTFVWLYFFNLLPNLSRELLAGLDDWRDLVGRSLNTSLWLACFIAVVGSLAAPMLLPLLFGPAYSAAVAPFQLVIWMIPVAWFSGHFRFSLIAAGHQRWEFAVSAATAVVTIASSGLLTPSLGSLGAAMALLLGGIVNAMLAYVAMSRHVGWVPLGRVTRPVVLTTAAALVVGLVMAAWSGTVAATTAGAIILAAVAVRQDNDLVRLVRPWIPW